MEYIFLKDWEIKSVLSGKMVEAFGRAIESGARNFLRVEFCLHSNGQFSEAKDIVYVAFNRDEEREGIHPFLKERLATGGYSLLSRDVIPVSAVAEAYYAHHPVDRFLLKSRELIGRALRAS